MLGWKIHELESRLPVEISINVDMQMTPPLWQNVKRKGYVGELLELQQGCEGPFGSFRGSVWLVSRCLSGNGPHVAWNGEAPGYFRVSAGALLVWSRGRKLMIPLQG